MQEDSQVHRVLHIVEMEALMRPQATHVCLDGILLDTGSVLLSTVSRQIPYQSRPSFNGRYQH